MRLHAHYVGNEVEGDYEEQDEENWGCRTSGVGLHHHIWVAEGGGGNTGSSTMPAVSQKHSWTYLAVVSVIKRLTYVFAKESKYYSGER